MACNLRRISMVMLLAILSLAHQSCLIQVKMNGASIDYGKIHSISIADFPNQAALVYPALSNSLTEGIKDLYQRQTRLQILRKGGDLELEGEITGYAIEAMAISADSYSAETKLTITVMVHYTNNVNPEENFDRSYTAYQTFDSNQLLDDVQESLCATMIAEIAEHIYNDTVARW